MRPFFRLRNSSRRASKAKSVRCVTPWILAKAFLDRCQRVFFGIRNLPRRRAASFPTLGAHLMRKTTDPSATAGLNRSIQAWHMAVFERRGFPAENPRGRAALRQPDEPRRLPYRVGYMDERQTDRSPSLGLSKPSRSKRVSILEFRAARGVEAEIIRGMQTCSVFLALNVGKSPLWGEGGPMTPS